jgi:hypothetical protein
MPASAGLGQAVRLHDIGAGSFGAGAEIGGEVGAADEDRPEGGEIRSGLDEPAEHRRNDRRELDAVLRHDRLRIEVRMHRDRRTEQDRAEQDEQAADVGEREATEPPVLVGCLERERRGRDGRVDRPPVELCELGRASGAARVDDQGDVRLGRSAIHSA